MSERAEAKDDRIIGIAKRYGYDYFDGDRKYGYGGYHYDGRWLSVAQDIINRYDLHKGSTVLDVGCAKGFLVKDLMTICPGLEAFGLDISEYAIKHCPRDLVGRLHLGSADDLPFPDGSFDLVLSINTIHNLPRANAVRALREMMRVSRFHRAFVQVDAYETDEQQRLSEQWILTAEYYGKPRDWFKLFEEAGYTGDYDWTIVEE